MSAVKTSLSETLLFNIRLKTRRYKLTILSSFIVGLFAHAYMFSNQLPNFDGVINLFGKGATVSSGRWGLELLKLLIPNYSMPWPHGVFSLLLLTVSSILIIELFDFQNPISQILLPALMVCFPPQTDIFCFMFTSSCYAVSCFLSVLGVYLVCDGGRKKLWAIPCLVFSMSIYQAYIALSASLMLLFLIKLLLDAGEKTVVKQVFRLGLLELLVLGISLVIYRLSIPVSMKIWNISINEYANEVLYRGPSITEGIITAYRMFFFNLISRFNMMIVSRFSRDLHAAALLLGFAGMCCNQYHSKNIRNTALLFLCLLLLPAAICCMYIRAEWSLLHTRVLVGFASLYVLTFLGIEHIPLPLKNAGRDLCNCALCLVVVINCLFANRCYLKLELQYEQAYSLCTSIIAQVRSLPSFRSDLKLALYPSAGYYLSLPEEISSEEGDMAGTGPLLNKWLIPEAQNDGGFIHNFIDAGIPLADGEEAAALMRTEEAKAMPCYPEPGSIQVIGEYVLVKFTDELR